MFSKGAFISLLLSVPIALSTPLSILRPGAGLVTRQSCVETCGSVCYWQSDITAAQNKGYSLYQSGQTLGSDKYPHEYYDDEGFDFAVAGPYQEFPILSSYQVYSGGSPGADRVVFNTKGQFARLITHTGASGNNFEQCTID